MHSKRRRSLQVIIFMLVAVGSASTIILYQLRANINYFYTPADLVANNPPSQTRIRVGGYVVNGSLHYHQDGSAQFVLTDRLAEVSVIYRGVLPGLFAEGDQAVVIGARQPGGQIVASQVMAKHDENYRPPELKELR